MTARGLTTLAIVGALALGLGACGSDSDDDAASSSPTPVPVKGEDLGAIKAYLLAHAEALVASTTDLA